MCVRRVVVYGGDYHRFCSGKQESRIAPSFSFALHPFHLAVKAIFQPIKEVSSLSVQALRADNADLIYTKI